MTQNEFSIAGTVCSRFSLKATVHNESRKWKCVMTDDLKKLIEVAKRVTPTPEQREEQRRSFAYGNTAFENSRITRDMIDRQAEKLAKDVNRTK